MKGPTDGASWLDPRTLRFDWDAQSGRLTLGLDVEVVPRRLFPLTRPTAFVELVPRRPDARPLGIVADVLALSLPSRTALLAALHARYFMARILDIHDIRPAHPLIRWTVTCDRGWRRFEVANTQESLKHWGEGRVICRDTAGNSYEIVDLAELSAQGRAAFLRHYL